MILSEYVDVKISNNQIKYFKEKGYDIKGGNEIISIKVSDLPNGSGCRIKAKCDICGKETEVNFCRYIINTKKLTTYYACSRKCAEEKNKDTLLNKYGVENVSNSQEIKDNTQEDFAVFIGAKGDGAMVDCEDGDINFNFRDNDSIYNLSQVLKYIDSKVLAGRSLR